MRAVAIREPGAQPELMEVPEPVPGAGEVLIKVLASSVNPMDWKIGEGQFARFLDVDRLEARRIAEELRDQVGMDESSSVEGDSARSAEG